MRKIAVIGAGNIGIAAAEALLESPDMELCGFIRRNAKPVPGFDRIPVAESVSDLPERPEGAISAVPSRLAESVEAELLEKGIYTADCFDIHEELSAMRKRLSVFAKAGNVSAIIGAGWDPGLDSVIRTLMLSAFSEGEIYTDFGPGMSMGHSAAARAVSGIREAVSLTLPLGKGKHIRKIYALSEKGADKTEIEHAVLSDGYFEHGLCSVEFVENIKPFLNPGHRVKIERTAGNENIKFSMEINNPKLTGRILVSAIRASFLQKPGAYFMPEVPPCDFCAGGWEKYI